VLRRFARLKLRRRILAGVSLRELSRASGESFVVGGLG
jgi:hypothetical protein